MALPACPTGSWYDVFRVCCANERVSAASLIINLAASRCAAQAWAPCRWNLRHVLTSPLHFAAHAAHAAHAARAALAAHAALAARAHVALATHAARAAHAAHAAHAARAARAAHIARAAHAAHAARATRAARAAPHESPTKTCEVCGRG